MNSTTALLRIGLIGAGANTKARHIPGLRALPGVVLRGVCNRRPQSTAQAAREFDIPKTYAHWSELVADPEIDAVVIGTWPYLHAPITLACLRQGKHVLTEARMACNALEAHQMLAASRDHPERVAQIVPSPFGLAAERYVAQLLHEGYVGELREIEVVSRNAALGEADAPLHWRQDSRLSGLNMLTLGIVQETLLRWTPSPTRVLAQAHAFIPARQDPSGVLRPVETPDCVQVLTILPSGTRVSYLLSGVAPLGGGMSIRFLGNAGMLHYDLLADRLEGIQAADVAAGQSAPNPLPIPPELRGQWQVESDWVQSIRSGAPVTHTPFAKGVEYMEFTEAVARSAETGCAVDLPLDEFQDDAE